MKKQYFCLLALCAFVGLTITKATYSNEASKSREVCIKKSQEALQLCRSHRTESDCQDLLKNKLRKCDDCKVISHDFAWRTGKFSQCLRSGQTSEACNNANNDLEKKELESCKKIVTEAQKAQEPAKK